MKDFYDANGGIISVKGPEEFGKFLVEEDKKWKELITIAGLKVD